MPKIAFWNIFQRTNASLVAELMASRGIEIMLLGEQGFKAAELIGAYNRLTGRALYEVIGVRGLPFEHRVRFYSTFPETVFRSITDHPRYSIKEYRPQFGLPLTLVGVHLPSKNSRKPEDQASAAGRTARRIREVENQSGHDRTIVIGDFNMDPFETAMIDSDIFHAVMDRRIAQGGWRTVDQEACPYFYNPMWKSMGDHTAPALGTYYLGPDSFASYFWHTLDQVLLRPSLLAHFRDQDLHVVDSIGETSLLSPRGLGPDRKISDHLPIVLQLTT